MHRFMHGPESGGPLAGMAVAGLPLHRPNALDIEVEGRRKSERLLIGHHLEEIKIPAAAGTIAAPYKRTGDLMIGMRVERPVRHEDVRLDFLQPSRDRVERLRVGFQFFVGKGKKRGGCPITLQAALASRCRTTASCSPPNRRSPRNELAYATTDSPAGQGRVGPEAKNEPDRAFARTVVF